MPLTPAKTRHIIGKYKQIFAGRTQLVNLTCKNPDGTTRVVAITAVLRPTTDLDPSIEATPGRDVLHSGDAVMHCLLSDVSLATLRSCIAVELATHGTGIEPASRYLINTIQSKGMVPGGDRFVISLVRQR